MLLMPSLTVAGSWHCVRLPPTASPPQEGAWLSSPPGAGVWAVVEKGTRDFSHCAEWKGLRRGSSNS